METKRFIYYQEGELLVGWLEEYPDYRTQGATMDGLESSPRGRSLACTRWVN